MRSKVLFTITIFFASLQSFAQLVTIKGKVTDHKTKQILQGVSVRIGPYGTSTDSEGGYVLFLQKNIAKQYGVTFTSVGYEKAKLDFAEKELNIALKPTSLELKEVVISSNSETIIQKAIRKIPENYPLQDFVMNGALRIVNYAKVDSANVYFYQSDAKLRLYYPGYQKKKMPDVMLVRKQDTLIVDPDNKPAIRWIGGYTSVPSKDYVHQRPEFLQPNTKKYKFVVNGKDWINDTRVHVVNFFSAEKPQNAGVIYIDTSSYAFVKIIITNYNVQSSISIDIDKRTNTVDYQKRGDKWYLSSTETNLFTNYGKFNLFKTINFKSAVLDTGVVKPFPYLQILPHQMEDVNISNPPLLSVSEPKVVEKPFNAITIPVIDTTVRTKGIAKTGRMFLEKVRDYLLGDNIQVWYGLTNFPLHLTGYQPALGRTIRPIGNYAGNSQTLFRLIKKRNLFLQTGRMFNMGIGGLRGFEDNYGLSYALKLNPKGRPITVWPSVAFSTFKLSKDKKVWYKHQSFVYGLGLSYEISPRLGWYVQGKYHDLHRTTNNGLVMETRPITLSTGLVFKIKM
ncbi:MAG: carboxypeptidase-like regulatory domain-containing protein [Pedobacter sp.]|nr:MAG: carboxypeptidase-like regulatory domain-containing protein [Pedobacter sp.]